MHVLHIDGGAENNNYRNQTISYLGAINDSKLLSPSTFNNLMDSNEDLSNNNMNNNTRRPAYYDNRAQTNTPTLERQNNNSNRKIVVASDNTILNNDDDESIFKKCLSLCCCCQKSSHHNTTTNNNNHSPTSTLESNISINDGNTRTTISYSKEKLKTFLCTLYAIIAMLCNLLVLAIIHDYVGRYVYIFIPHPPLKTSLPECHSPTSFTLSSHNNHGHGKLAIHLLVYLL
jgi:hypothetical protein